MIFAVVSRATSILPFNIFCDSVCSRERFGFRFFPLFVLANKAIIKIKAHKSKKKYLSLAFKVNRLVMTVLARHMQRSIVQHKPLRCYHFHAMRECPFDISIILSHFQIARNDRFQCCFDSLPQRLRCRMISMTESKSGRHNVMKENILYLLIKWKWWLVGWYFVRDWF